ncbi:hypothetical protein RHSIM_Rhsim05G0037900 [Rhododendron simsii]|uniref:VQ domain-containing protein n=1 Tax=Rhododendron simsii TaxID=118357 RepID=A0A834LNT9_RHOSS|nr:hypothetical protein RHSIM_Rhsim05G0037900 [Rhododendron simsii]
MSNNIEARTLRPLFDDSWNFEPLTRDTETPAKALQKSISDHHYSNSYSTVISPLPFPPPEIPMSSIPVNGGVKPTKRRWLSNNIESRTLRPLFDNSWNFEPLARDTETPAKALQKSISDHHYSNSYSTSISPLPFPPPEIPMSSIPVNGGGKRIKWIAAKTFKAADTAEFRQMVSQLSGVKSNPISLPFVPSNSKKNMDHNHAVKVFFSLFFSPAGRPPDQHGEKILSPTGKTLSTNGQNEMENEIVGHLEETNEFLLDFVEGPNGGVSSEWAFELRDQWTVSTSYPNSNGPEVPHPHIASTQILRENMGSLGDRRNSFGSLEEHILQGHNSGSMWTVPPCSDPASGQHMPTITPTMGSSEDLTNSLAFLEDDFLEEDVSGSISWTIPTCFEPAPSQLMPSVPRTSGSSDDLGNLLPSVEECFSARHVSGFINGTFPSCSYPGPSQPMSIVAHTTGSSDALRNLLASVEEPFGAGHVSESINLTVPSCFDPAASQFLPTIPHTMPTTPQMMPLLTGRQDMGSVRTLPSQIFLC